MSYKKTGLPGLTRSQKKKIIVASIIFWLIGVPVIYYYVESLTVQARTQKTNIKGWIIRTGDTATYEIYVNSNSTETYTLCDKVADAYHFAYILKNKNTFGSSKTTIKVTNVYDTENITKIAELIISLKGPASISQKLGEIWERRINTILPFFVPVGYWDNLSTAFFAVLPVGSMVSHTHSWPMEHNFDIHYTENDTQVDLSLSWNENNGILDALTLNATKGSKLDSISFILSGDSIAHELEANNVSHSLEEDLLTSLLVIILVGPLITVLVVIGSKTNYKMPWEKQELVKRYKEILSEFDEIKRTLRVGIVLVSIVGWALGVLWTDYMIHYHITFENETWFYYLIIFSFNIPLGLGILTEGYFALNLRDIDKKPENQSILALLAFVFGILDYFVILITQSVADLQVTSLVTAGAIAIESMIVYKMVSLFMRNIEKTKEDIETKLEQSEENVIKRIAFEE